MTQNAFPTLNGNPPLVIAHRGASGVLPEHTIAAYQRAIDMGADYIEPDLVITKDGVLVARHDRHLSKTTDIATRAEFADRKREDAYHDGMDWFIEDFTLAEIKTLRALQPRAGRPTKFDGQYEIPTFEEILRLAKLASKTTGRPIGIYPETKQPTAFAAAGLRHDEAMLETLLAFGYEGAEAPVFIQSFEMGNLKRLNSQTDIRLIYLTETRPDFAETAKIVDGIGPYKKLLLTDAGEDTGFVAAAHAAGLAVHPWTFRDDALDPNFSDIETEMSAYFALGVDGVFSDFPDTAIRVRDQK
ncbi:glycerophosphoryl diester phosphodiesterase [Litorimonas cladophorae]|uniref:glycerophosphodiester phosphodiesterase n=1 Tax=Litorimonas cladophorae TaxID=1220491 RepID=A0A918NDX2_9PROT|nr:glycerophosphodiester phosphodiesterase family protein [Litorimonas cladophorae]GGX65323.1 glycerophosphoryl diester phosphodiesterase [Litorimonas cladophorae]